MTREYPFSLINNNEVDIKTATAIALKFLMENNCLGDYVEAWRSQHNETIPSESSKDTTKYVVKRTIEVLRRYGFSFRDFFGCIPASFYWIKAENELGQDSFMWQRINLKWRDKVGNKVKII